MSLKKWYQLKFTGCSRKSVIPKAPSPAVIEMIKHCLLSLFSNELCQFVKHQEESNQFNCSFTHHTREGTIGNISEDVKLRGIGITDYNYSNPIAHSVEYLPTISNGFCKVYTFNEDIRTLTYAFFSVAKDVSWDIFILQVGRIFQIV